MSIDKCANCLSTGLAIMPFRYAIFPKDFKPSMPPGIDGERIQNKVLKAKKSDKASHNFDYGLRAMRTGYLYVLYESDQRGNKNVWRIYMVSEDGALLPLPVNTIPPSPPKNISCNMTQHDEADLFFIRISEPEKCGDMYFMFTDNVLSAKTLKKLETDTTIRQRRMQVFSPKAWINKQKQPQFNLNAHAKNAKDAVMTGNFVCEATEDNFKKIPEFQYTDDQFNFDQHKTLAIKDPQKNTIDFNKTALEMVETEFIFYSRVAPPIPAQGAQAGSGKPSAVMPKTKGAKDIVALMKKCSQVNAKQSFVPVMIALWDPVGIARELNSYRNQAIGKLAKFSKETAIESLALTGIKNLKNVLENNVAQKAYDKYEDKAQDERYKGYSEEKLQHVKKIANSPTAPAQKRQRAQEYANRIEFYRANHVPYANPNFGSFSAQIYNEDAPESKYRADLATLDKEVNEYLAKKQKEVQKADSGWQKEYAPLINQSRYQSFEALYKRLSDEAQYLADQRTADLVMWLDSALLADVLKYDFDKESIADGIKYRDIVADIIYAMDGSPTGKAKLKEWLNSKNIKDDNFVMNALIYNQASAVAELEALIEETKDHSARLTAANHATTFVLAKWNKIADVYKKAQTLVNTNIKAQNEIKANQKLGAAPFKPSIKPFSFLGAEKLIATVGMLFMDSRMMRAVDTTVSEWFVKSILLGHAGAQMKDVFAVIETETKQIKNEAQRLIEQARRESQALSSINKSNQELKAKWLDLVNNATIGINPAGTGTTVMNVNAVVDVRIAQVILVLEAFNLCKATYGLASDRDGRAFTIFMAGIASLAGAAADVRANYLKALFGDSHLGFQYWKFVGANLSLTASLLGVVADTIALAKYLKKGENTLATLSLFSAIFGGGGALFSYAGNFTYCKELFAKIAEQMAKQAAQNMAKGASLRAGAWLVGRAVFQCLGLWASLAVLACQYAIYQLQPSEVKVFLEGCAFGIKPNKIGTSLPEHEAQLAKSLANSDN